MAEGRRAIGAIAALAVMAMMMVGCAPTQVAQAPQPVQSEEPAYTTPVPAPGGSTIDEVEEPADPVDTSTVLLDEPAEVGGGVSARITDIQPLDVTAKTPGEISGPAVAVTISISNDGDEAIDVSSAMVSLLAAGDELGQPTTSDPYRPFHGVVDAGASADAVYVFLLPEDARSAFDVSVQYRAGTTIARFVDES